MSSYVAGAIIGGVAVLLATGFATGFAEFRAARIRKADHDVVFRAELKTAMREFLAALDAVILEASGEIKPPKLNRLERRLVAATEHLGLDFIGEVLARILHRVMYGQRHDQVIDRLIAASAHLRLIAPPAIDDLMHEMDGLGSATSKETRRGRPSGWLCALGCAPRFAKRSWSSSLNDEAVAGRPLPQTHGAARLGRPRRGPSTRGFSRSHRSTSARDQ